MLRLMPSSYYSFAGGVNPLLVVAQLVSVDFFQTLMHIAEHKVSPAVYQASHKPHHRFLNPKLFDAFDGSSMDTLCMILLPLFLTANIVHCNVWEYMAFGSTYASWLCLIHSEYAHPWDPLFRLVGLGTPADHHVHHRLFLYNYGHLFMWWDKLFGTFKDPAEVKSFNHSSK
jgi:sterol desaturase/sphingolipid hydroxylase (fatty acid hydroxylase superfamily)